MNNYLKAVAKQFMNKFKSSTALLTAVFFCVFFTANVAAQRVGSVVESRPVGTNNNSQATTFGQDTTYSTETAVRPIGGDALNLLLDQLQDLKTEVQALRGLVEEQGFELRKMRRSSLDRYTNLDERLISIESNPVAVNTPPMTSNALPNSNLALLNNGGGGVSSGLRPAAQANGLNAGVSRPLSTINNQPANTALNTGVNRLGDNGLASNNGLSTNARRPITSQGNAVVGNSRPTSRATLQPAVLSEQQLYQMAYESVIGSQFDRSIAEFDQYLGIYPTGRFVTNAHYWKGQAFLYLDRFGDARDAYDIILNQYQDSTKLPDAMYGLGLAYEGLGDVARAKQLMRDIKRRYPNTGVANLADTRLLSLD
ncbi:MAG: hypothetical protein COC19_01020 [SAR86 cluster bacterium]|uniref:Cell division coordinator CpoB n=1 Tax=SAR86 cluster bacterium TaxID=2030880 RepID=A0A2A4MTR5_9GAMM|nr:MAG: hypothetical protein COC19_01020 [SAR86 cluster bacterium]